MPPPAPAPAAATMQPASNSAAALAAARDCRVVLDVRIRTPPKAASSLPRRILREYTCLGDPPATVPQAGARVTQITDSEVQNRNLCRPWNRSWAGLACGSQRSATTKAKRL